MAFSNYETITIDSSLVAATLTDFPLLVSGTYSFLATVANGGLVQNANGYDIAFYSDSGLTTLLKWETEKYTATTGEVVYWVKIPSLSDSVDTDIYLAYGDSGITTDQSDKNNVWDSSYQAVYHLAEATSSNNLDSTATGADLAPTNSPTQTAGEIDGSLDFNGSSQYTEQSGTGFAGITPSAATGFTVSCWIKVDDFASSGGVNRRFFNFYNGTDLVQMACSDDGGTANSIGVRLDYNGSGSIGGAFDDGAALSTGVWYHIGFSYSSGTGEDIYINGVIQSTPVGTTVTFGSGSNTNKIILGARSGPSGYFDGQIDEVRITEGIRDANWLLTEYTNQNDPATFYSITTPSATGEVKTYNGIPIANIKTINGIPIANIKSINGKLA